MELRSDITDNADNLLLWSDYTAEASDHPGYAAMLKESGISLARPTDQGSKAGIRGYSIRGIKSLWHATAGLGAVVMESAGSADEAKRACENHARGIFDNRK